MSREIVSGDCPNCGLTRMCILSEGTMVCLPRGEHERIGLFGVCCACLAFLDGTITRGETFDRAIWSPIDDQALAFMLAPRTPDEVLAETFGPAPSAEF
jgi:hypothetical protein